MQMATIAKDKGISPGAVLLIIGLLIALAAGGHHIWQAVVLALMLGQATASTIHVRIRVLVICWVAGEPETAGKPGWSAVTQRRAGGTLSAVTSRVVLARATSSTASPLH